METQNKCQVCGEVKIPEHQRSTGQHAICYGCSEVAIEEGLLVEDCDDLLYEYTDKSKGVNWIEEEKVEKTEPEQIDKENKMNGLKGKLWDLFSKYLQRGLSEDEIKECVEFAEIHYEDGAKEPTFFEIGDSLMESKRRKEVRE